MRKAKTGSKPPGKSSKRTRSSAANQKAPPKRTAGSMKGKIWMAPDFDELPQDVLAAFNGLK